MSCKRKLAKEKQLPGIVYFFQSHKERLGKDKNSGLNLEYSTVVGQSSQASRRRVLSIPSGPVVSCDQKRAKIQEDFLASSVTGTGTCIPYILCDKGVK